MKPVSKNVGFIAKEAGVTNDAQRSLVKVVARTTSGRWITPNAQQEFFIDEASNFPAITFEIDTDQPGPYAWSWTITWDAKVRPRENVARGQSKKKTFIQNRIFNSDQKRWQADLDGKTLGGMLTVEVKAGKDTFIRAVIIKAKNPTVEAVKAFLDGMENVAGFELVIEKESGFKNFINTDGEPMVTFDGGYGLTQMTNPAPTYEQIWNWKENVKGGSGVYQGKQKIASVYLGKDSREFTEEQLKLETLSRWNGGSYHVWSTAHKQWQRKENIQCDSETGNIGWDLNATVNKNKTEAELHDRDKGTYKNPRQDKKDENKWIYTGVCYADELTNE